MFVPSHFAAALLVGAGLMLSGPSVAAADETEAHCLALALYWEAKTEGREGMLAVASVIFNRVAHPQFPNTVCAVVEQGGRTPPCQFSWWCDGKSDRPTEPGNWASARALAAEALRQSPEDRTEGALFFHNTQITNPWVRKRQRTVQIGRHIFYR